MEIYKYHPAYTEGQYAHDEGVRRGQNPYSSGDNQTACIAWWYGWDAAEEEASQTTQADGGKGGA